jgi:hypothetical protein
MTDPLSIYLHDHLGAAQSAVELLDYWQEKHRGEPLGIFAAELRTEVEADVAELRQIIARVGASPHSMKEAAGWLAEKASRFKLRHEHSEALGVFEGLEMLALGVLGKRALWEALEVVAVSDPRLQETDLEKLAVRAKQQHARIEARRINHAAAVFGRPT